MPEATPTLGEFISGIDLFVDPILCAAVAGLVLGVLGVYIVLRRMIFVSAAASHAAGLGVALAFYLGIHGSKWAFAPGSTLSLRACASPVFGAFLLGVGSTLLLAFPARQARLPREALIGLTFILASATAIVVGDRIAQESHDIQAIIFGTAVMVRRVDLWTTLGVGALVLVVHVWLRRGFIFASFDPEAARVQRVPVRLLDTTLMLTIGVMISVTARAIGAMPVFAFSVLPAVAALGVSRRLRVVFVLSATFGLLSAVLGYLLSFFGRCSVGASQALVAGVFALSGVLIGRLRRR